MQSKNAPGSGQFEVHRGSQIDRKRERGDHRQGETGTGRRQEET